MTAVLELVNIKKSYGENTVLKGVSFSLEPGEIRGVIGENGAGKSTMMNIIFGMPVIHETGGYEGDVRINGQKIEFKSPFEAIDAGLGMVHQEFMLIPGMSVLENIKLNRESLKQNGLQKFLPRKLRVLNRKAMMKDVTQALKTVGLDVSPDHLIEGMPVGHMQFIEIAREVDRKNVKVLVFDEPTAVLAESEASQLLQTMKHLAKNLGIAVLFISHRLAEIEEVCDTITVIRDGALIGNYKKGDINALKMAELMVGRETLIEPKSTTNATDEVILSVKNIKVNMPGERVKDVSFEVKRGEIVGIGGLAGQGKLGIANGIAGLYPIESGQVIYKGEPLDCKNPLKVLQKRIGFLSEDRRSTGLILEESIAHNMMNTAFLALGRFTQTGIGKYFRLLCKKAVKAYASQMMEAFQVKATSQDQAVGRLSGGNQQKVCLSRVLAIEPEFLMVSEPTRGVDVGAKKLILDRLIELNKQGMTIIVTSSELVELKAICDRILIVSGGHITGDFSVKAPDAEIGLAMSA